MNSRPRPRPSAAPERGRQNESASPAMSSPAPTAWRVSPLDISISTKTEGRNWRTFPLPLPSLDLMPEQVPISNETVPNGRITPIDRSPEGGGAQILTHLTTDGGGLNRCGLVEP